MTVGAPNRMGVTAARVMLAAMAVGLGLLTYAMSRYPGGTAIDATAVGHSFWFNFLCDLTNDVAVNGRPNHLAATFARAAMAVFSLALACFWIILPIGFRDSPRLASAIKMFGIPSVLGLIVAPLATGRTHVVAVLLSAVAALIAGILGLVGVMRSSRTSLGAGSRAGSRAWLGFVLPCATVAAAAWDSLLYARSYMVHPRVVAPALPLFQRVAAILLVLWMGAVGVAAVGRPRRRYVETKR